MFSFRTLPKPCLLLCLALVSAITLVPILTKPVAGTDFVTTAARNAGDLNDNNGSHYAGSASTDSKVSADSAYQSGGVVYGPNNPIMYTGLSASVIQDYRTDGFHYLDNFKISIKITDSYGNVVSGSRIGNLGLLDSPHDQSGSTDYVFILLDMYNFLSQFAHLPTSPNLQYGQSASGVQPPDSNGVSATWHNTNTPLTAMIDKALSFRYQPNFPTAGVYTVAVTTSTELWVVVPYNPYFFQQATTSYSYSFVYVYENDAGGALGDAGNTFGTAMTIGPGSYNGFLYGADGQDWYQFWANSGQQVSFSMTPPTTSNFDLKIFDPNDNYLTGSFSGVGATDSVNIQATGNGYYRAQVYIVSGWGQYGFSLSITNPPPDFTIASNPGSVNINQGVTGTSTVTVSAVNGFTGTVNLFQSVSPSTGLSCSLNPVSITTSGTSTLSCSGSTGSYTVTVTGSSGSTSHSTTVLAAVSSMTTTLLSNNPSSSDWTKLSGTWAQVGGNLDGSGSYPEIKSTNTFQADRTVTANVVTITAGPNNWDTAWLRGKYIDDNNKIMMYLRNDKYLEIDVKRSGTTCANWCYYPASQSTGQLPTAWHSFQMVFSGNEIKGSIDGLATGSIDITDPIFGSFGTSNVVLYIGLNLRAEFNSVTITTSGSPPPNQKVLSNDPGSSDWVKICGCGTWNLVGGYIDGQNAWAELKSSATFASDRTVQLRMISLTTGSQVYNTAWVRPKYIDNNNEIILLLHTDKVLELSIVYQGTQRTLAQVSTNLLPTDWHTYKITISGNTVNVWVDGTQYFTPNLSDPNGSISALGATSVALMNGGNTHSQFDSATISW